MSGMPEEVKQILEEKGIEHEPMPEPPPVGGSPVLSMNPGQGLVTSTSLAVRLLQYLQESPTGQTPWNEVAVMVSELQRMLRPTAQPGPSD